MIRYAIPTLLLLILSTISEATHAPAGSIINPKRHAPAQSIPKTGIPRRSNPFGNQPLSKPSRLSQLANTLRGRKAHEDRGFDPRLGPGPGPDGAISARNRERHQATKVLQKRQGAAAPGPTSASGPGAPSGTASGAQPAATNLNASHPTWILSDVYATASFWK